MNRVVHEGHNFVGYEYKEIYTDTETASQLIDCYYNFGWQLDDNFEPIKDDKIKNSVKIKLKRDRRIINKTELTRLQRNFESCQNELKHLRDRMTQLPLAISLLIGLIGTAAMAGSVFAVTAEQPKILLSIILAIPAFAGWIMPYFIYHYLFRKKNNELAPLVEAKYDEIYDICEKGAQLLYGYYE